ncbi:MAG: glycosyl hydrolase family 18 protein [Bacteroidales bacterium]|nr:glycosyl hydrolase family 18 protein [Bacteroidales bacterium]
MVKFCGAILIFLSFNVLYSQPFKSIRQQELEYYSQFSVETDEDWNAIRGEFKPNGRTKSKACTLNKIVFGWHPYWSNGLEANYDWSLLTDLSYFCYAVNPNTGNATSTNNWSTANVVTQALAHGVRVNLCVTLFSDHATFLTNSTAKQTLINNLISLVSQRGAHGVNIDFEGLPSSQKTNFTNFMIDLCNQFHSQIPNSQVSLCLYSVDWNNVFDIPTLKNYVDLFTIMGYDYYYSGSSTAGPTSPLYSLTSSYDYNVTKSITYYLNAGVPANKLVLGLPYYGIEWTTSGSSVPSSTTGTGSSRTYKTVKNNSSGYYTANNKQFNYTSYVPYYVFNDGSSWRQCWIDDGYTLGKKFELVWKRGIAGIAIWALGYDDGYPDLWNKIEEKLTTCFTNNCVDTIFDMGGPDRNYYNNESYTYTIQPSNASSVQLTFQSFNLETKDTLWLYDGSSTTSPLIGAYTGTNNPGTIQTTQPALTIRFKSDGSTTASGFMAKWQCIIDNIPPTTTINTLGNWKTQDFTANFIDNDNINIDKAFYQVLDFDGLYWGANYQRGFFGDNFDILQSNWTIYNGTWTVQNGELHQSDENLSNTNIYAPLNQTLSNRYLYHFKAKISGSGTNKRFGFHFFSDNANLANRGNSYFVWFRVDDQQLQFYKVINDTFQLKHTINNIATNLNQMYDFKITYDRITGKICVWRDDVFLGSWTDSSPYSTNGNYISFRTGNCKINVTELKVYRSRAASVTVTVGGNTKDIRYQNPNPQTSSAKIKSIVVDVNNNLSTIAYHDLNVDWTPPQNLSNIRDGLGPDTDTISTTTTIAANWDEFDDPHSGIAEYWYSIGTQPGLADVLSWTNNATHTYFSITLALQINQTYYINIKAKNNAGLWSTVYSSDGATCIPNGGLPTAHFTLQFDSICAHTPLTLYNESLFADSVEWYITGGYPSYTNLPNPTVVFNQSGAYPITLVSHNTNGFSTFTDTIYVLQTPELDFTWTVINQQPPFYVVFQNNSQYANFYFWDFGDGQTSNDPNPYHIYSNSGNYIVTLTASNTYCNSIITDTIALIPTNIPFTLPVGINVFPNPTSQFIAIKSQFAINKVNIYNLLHQNLLSVDNSFDKIDVSTLPSGIYFLHIETVENSYKLKFIKK